MATLPVDIRDLLSEQIDEFIGSEEEFEIEDLVIEIINFLEQHPEEIGIEGVEDIIAYLEESGDLEGSLEDILGDQLEQEDLSELLGQDIVALLARICNIEWAEDDDYGVEELDEDLEFQEEEEDEEDEEYEF